MKLKCATCNTVLQLRDGRYGKFYYCPSSTQKKPHGTVSKSVVDEYVALNLQNIATSGLEKDRELLRHLRQVQNTSADSALGLFTNHAMLEDVEQDQFWADIIPRG